MFWCMFVYECSSYYFLKWQLVNSSSCQQDDCIYTPQLQFCCDFIIARGTLIMKIELIQDHLKSSWAIRAAVTVHWLPWEQTDIL